jgi:hypothetical protein
LIFLSFLLFFFFFSLFLLLFLPISWPLFVFLFLSFPVDPALLFRAHLQGCVQVDRGAVESRTERVVTSGTKAVGIWRPPADLVDL